LCAAVPRSRCIGAGPRAVLSRRRRDGPRHPTVLVPGPPGGKHVNSFVRVLRTPELRGKILFTLGLLAIYRLGVFVPTPGFDYTNVMLCSDQAMASQGSSVLGMVSLFSGGALLQLSIFSLGVMPYITASIIIQLLRVVIPRFEALHKEGQSGTAKLTQYTRYLTIALAILQSTTGITTARNGLLFQGCPVDAIPARSVVTLPPSV